MAPQTLTERHLLKENLISWFSLVRVPQKVILRGQIKSQVINFL